MRSTALAAMLLAACGFVCAKSADAPTRSIGVFFGFEDHPSRSTVDVLEREVDSIMKPAGLVFSWRELGGQQDQASFADLIVIRFKGSCEGVLAPFSELGPDPNEGSSLASTKTSNGRVLHFTEVHCDEMRRYLAADVSRLDANARNTVYGRALGRIVAHEMWHVFAGTEKHASGGVARACHSRRELLQPVFAFDPKETRILRDYASRALWSREANPEP